jgi:2-polyprenyl-3-methyl-5-hydroxy-6-metoxy-1,4-benzoquinol methylase
VSTVPTDSAAAWDRYAAAYQAAARWPTDVVHYAPDVPTEASLRLLGDLKGRRVLDLGCGAGQVAIACAKQGATVIGVDASGEQLAIARRLAEQEGVRVELRHADLADLAFVQSDSIDLVLSTSALEYIEDIGRVFRQCHRVLKVGAPLVFSTVHPAWRVLDGRSYFDRAPVEVAQDNVTLIEYPHTFADLTLGLARTNFRVETILEPEPDGGGPRSPWWREPHRQVPRTIIFKARKEGN